ncbi:hypothetical protein [Bacillus sp. FJAT-49736]|uniref:hypothetical protein n=1 Tax=Bacillus sp. FJAT-49736 TaxID=2833582 RepID=UPI001BC952AD|nr:hypothetical protein [Bacillus sp. FJAT-49736]MBS4175060.1 hypothetical protein [Bacillus sp. FJAT-49736]
MSNFYIAILILLVIVRSQLRIKPLRRSMFTFPILLLLYALYSCSKAGVDIGEGIGMVIVFSLGAIVGLFQGKFVNVYCEKNEWVVAGSWVTLAIWLVSVPIRYLIKFSYIELLDIPVHLNGNYAYVPFLISIAGILIGKVIMLTIRFPQPILSAANHD